jgi:hypothetical protein
LLNFVDSPLLRKNVQTALNRGESYHQLRRAVSYANFGKLRFTKAPEPINMEEIVEVLAHHPILSMVDEEDA